MSIIKKVHCYDNQEGKEDEELKNKIQDYYINERRLSKANKEGQNPENQKEIQSIF